MSAIQQMLLSYGATVSVSSWFEIAIWTGTGVGDHVHTGLDLSGGGLVWVKRRNASQDHKLYFKQTSGATVYAFSTNNTTAMTSPSATLDSTGFTVPENISGATYVAWIFKKQALAFDIATWTGNATAGRTVAHALGVAPGFTVACQLTGTKINYSQHIGLAATVDIRLDLDAASATSNTRFFNTYVSSSVITLGNSSLVNGTGITGFAFLFGGSDVAAGSYAGSASPVNVSTGFDPRFFLAKRVDTTAPWGMFDTTRSPGFTGSDSIIVANTAAAETSSAVLTPITNGLTIATGTYNSSASANIYLAIR